MSPGDDNPYRLSMEDLEQSTGHAPGEPLVEIEPEVEQHYEPPIRVTPMSPVTEIQALGQMTTTTGSRRSLARAAALIFLGLLVGGLAWQAITLLTA